MRKLLIIAAALLTLGAHAGQFIQDGIAEIVTIDQVARDAAFTAQGSSTGATAQAAAAQATADLAAVKTVVATQVWSRTQYPLALTAAPVLSVNTLTGTVVITATSLGAPNLAGPNVFTGTNTFLEVYKTSTIPPDQYELTSLADVNNAIAQALPGQFVYYGTTNVAPAPYAPALKFALASVPAWTNTYTLQPGVLTLVGSRVWTGVVATVAAGSYIHYVYASADIPAGSSASVSYYSVLTLVNGVSTQVLAQGDVGLATAQVGCIPSASQLASNVVATSSQRVGVLRYAQYTQGTGPSTMPFYIYGGTGHATIPASRNTRLEGPAIAANAIVADAPKDSKLYGRLNGAWSSAALTNPAQFATAQQGTYATAWNSVSAAVQAGAALGATSVQAEVDPTALHLDQTTPQNVINGKPNLAAGLILGGAVDDGTTRQSVAGLEVLLSCPDAFGFTENYTYGTVWTLEGIGIMGIYPNYLGGGNFNNDTVTVRIWQEGYGMDNYWFYSSSSYNQVADYTGNPFSVKVDFYSLMGSSAYVYDYIVAVSSSQGDFYTYVDNMTYAIVIDGYNGTGWYQGDPYQWIPYNKYSPHVQDAPNGYLYGPFSWSLWGYKTVQGIKTFSANSSGVSAYGDPYGALWKNSLSWSYDSDIDGYILESYNSFSGEHWIDVGDVTTQDDNGDYQLWNQGPPTITPTSVSIYGDFYAASNVFATVKLTSLGQLYQSQAAVKPFDIQSTNLNDNLNADLLDGYHAAYFNEQLVPLYLGDTLRTIQDDMGAWIAVENYNAVLHLPYSGAPTPPTGITGGTVTYTNGYEIHTFLASGSLVVPADCTGRVLVVAGGGPGGNLYHGAGGGAGGAIETNNYPIAAGTYTVTVGAGGSAGGVAENSEFASLLAYGGGRGGQNAPDENGQPGGSGGGASLPAGVPGAGLAGPPRQGYDGGNFDPIGYGAGGGGGAGGPGGDGNLSIGGAGGTGIFISWAGTPAYYAGGGGGACFSGTGGPGGQGGGGAGGNNSGMRPGAGTANTGGGGGGAERGVYGTGGSGGSGIVIVGIRGPPKTNNYPLAVVMPTGMTVSGNTNSYFQVNIQNSSTGSSASADYVATANNGSDTNRYIDMGINNSSGGVVPFTGADWTYLYSSDDPLYIGSGVVNARTNSSINFFVGTGTVAQAIITTNGMTVGGVAVATLSPYQPWSAVLTPPASAGTTLVAFANGTLPLLVCTGAQTVGVNPNGGWGAGGVNRFSLSIWTTNLNVTVQSNAYTRWGSSIAFSTSRTNTLLFRGNGTNDWSIYQLP